MNAAATGPAGPADGLPDLHLAQDERADRLLSTDAFALLVGMLLDQQFPMEKAFLGPRLILDRLVEEGRTTDQDRLDPAVVAEVEEQEFARLMARPPAVHRYPQSMAARVQAVARYVVREFEGQTAELWLAAPTGVALLARLRALPGFGAQKASIFVALLAKQLRVQPEGWERASGDYALPGFRSVADVVDARTLAAVRETKRSAKAAARAARATAGG